MPVKVPLVITQKRNLNPKILDKKTEKAIKLANFEETTQASRFKTV